MRELAVRLKFLSPCLGNVCRYYQVDGRQRNHYLLPRSPDGKVIFMATWWHTILAQAAKTLCRHHGEVRKIRFALEVEGQPRPLVETEEAEATGRTYRVLKGHYLRYYKERRYVPHEAFFPGDVITVTAMVPETISDDDFGQLMIYAGRYWGISPAKPNQFGFFTVESIRPTGIGRMAGAGGEEEEKTGRPPTCDGRPECGEPRG